MRLWLINPKLLCRQHLLGEHLECHMFAGAVKSGQSLKGYIDNGLVELDKIKERHDQLAKEMLRRGYKHRSSLEQPDLNRYKEWGKVDINKNYKELFNRCKKCKERRTKSKGY